jgi:hypothetical protein
MVNLCSKSTTYIKPHHEEKIDNYWRENVMTFTGVKMSPLDWTTRKFVFVIQTPHFRRLDKLSRVAIPLWHNCRGRQQDG